MLSSNNDYTEILKALKDNGGNLDRSGITLILINLSKILIFAVLEIQYLGRQRQRETGLVALL